MANNKAMANIQTGFAMVLLAGLVLVAPHMIVQAAGDQTQPSVIVQLAAGVQDSPLPMRTDFAWLALTQMTEFYTEEADRARSEARNTARAHDASQWAAAVDDYAGRISALADSITPATPIRISIGLEDSVYVYVDGQPVILTGAISGQQSVYEQRVAERFCILYICEDLLPGLEPGEHELSVALPDTDGSKAYWSFSQYAGPVCMTDDGLEFQFQQLSGLAEKRTACSRVVTELSELARAIAQGKKRGVRIDWDALEVLPAMGDGLQRVLLAAGIEIGMALPMLADNPRLLKIVSPWLRARVRGETYPLVVLNAEHLLGLGDTSVRSTDNQRYPVFNAAHQ